MFEKLRNPKVWITLLVGCVLLLGIMLANNDPLPEQTPLDTSVPNPNEKPRVVFGNKRGLDQPKRDSTLDDLLKKK